MKPISGINSFLFTGFEIEKELALSFINSYNGKTRNQ